MSKKLIVCIIKSEYNWFDIGTTVDYLREINEQLRHIVQEGCILYTDSFTSGSQSHEKMAFLIMTEINDEELYKIVDNVCGDSYTIHILA